MGRVENAIAVMGVVLALAVLVDCVGEEVAGVMCILRAEEASEAEGCRSVCEREEEKAAE